MSVTTSFPQSAPARNARDLRILDWIDARVRSVATSFGAHEMRYPALIARNALEKAEYPEAFPHLLMSACRSSAVVGEGEPDPWCLSPAVCYHAYAHFQGRVLDVPTLVTARGRCFRAEREASPGVRQIEFEMREIVALGSAAWVDTCAGAVQAAIGTLAEQLGLPGDWQPAEDPFFLPAAAGKALMQRMLKVKLEYQWPRAGGLALASVNRHGAFFGTRFAITDGGGQPVHSACVAVGLDRWAYQARHPLFATCRETTP